MMLGLKRKASAAIDYPAIKWCPGIHCPPAVGLASQKQQRVPTGLTHIGEVLQVQEQLHVGRNFLLGHCADKHVGQGEIR